MFVCFIGRTPLLFAKYHNGGTAEYLLDHGANPDKANNDGAFLLHYAAELVQQDGKWCDTSYGC